MAEAMQTSVQEDEDRKTVFHQLVSFSLVCCLPQSYAIYAFSYYGWTLISGMINRHQTNIFESKNIQEQAKQQLQQQKFQFKNDNLNNNLVTTNTQEEDECLVKLVQRNKSMLSALIRFMVPSIPYQEQIFKLFDIRILKRQIGVVVPMEHYGNRNEEFVFEISFIPPINEEGYNEIAAKSVLDLPFVQSENQEMWHLTSRKFNVEEWFRPEIKGVCVRNKSQMDIKAKIIFQDIESEEDFALKFIAWLTGDQQIIAEDNPIFVNYGNNNNNLFNNSTNHNNNSSQFN